jgi:hypothetical protein
MPQSSSPNTSAHTGGRRGIIRDGEMRRLGDKVREMRNVDCGSLLPL